MLALAILLARALNGSIMGKISIRRSREGLCIATTMIMDHHKYVQNSSLQEFSLYVSVGTSARFNTLGRLDSIRLKHGKIEVKKLS